MLHVCSYEMTGSQSTAKRKLTSENSSGHNAGQPPGVLTWAGGVGTADAEQVEHGGLGIKDSATTERANLNGGHGDGDLQGPTEATKMLVQGASE